MDRAYRSHALNLRIVPFTRDQEAQVLALSLRAWAPVFEKLQPAVQAHVYEAFYPNGWRVRQADDIADFLRAQSQCVWVAVEGETVVGWIGAKLHPEDRMGEIHILAVDPDHQRRGVASALMDHAMSEMRRAGMAIVMVETADDPGHAPSRASYERAGFERWPVAR